MRLTYVEVKCRLSFLILWLFTRNVEKWVAELSGTREYQPFVPSFSST